ncbi:hypothetical protein GCM10010216_21520 [Streptomyces flaveolus]|nr:hypothetical protein GCM10010216_21520 [Streptomyces flaveolus]
MPYSWRSVSVSPTASRPTPAKPTARKPCRETAHLVLEIGAGFHTPGVIRLSAERVAQSRPHTRLIGINDGYPEVPQQLAGRALSIALSADRVISPLARPQSPNQ